MSVNNPAASNGLTMDLRSLDRLKGTSGTNPRAAVRETAKQLESLFMGELMKSMRASTMSTGMFDNSGSEMATGMLDTQFAGQMTGRPGGLADAITRQLERQMGLKPEALDKAGANAGTTAGASPFSRVASERSFKELGQLADLGDLSDLNTEAFPGGNGTDLNDILRRAQSLDRGKSRTSPASNTAGNVTSTPEGKRLSHSEQFIRKHHDAAKAAEAATGIASGHILGQAALESGWGKHEIKMKDGTSSHNLFGIKATSNWTGKVAEVTTTEYIGGVARKVTAKFRAYDSYEDAFKDHARLLTQSPRYSQTVAKADTAQGYAQGLQKAGYATDPAYANKLTQVINTALRVQRSLA
jgi:peptidoglycan hydrolase FlgJ